MRKPKTIKSRVEHMEKRMKQIDRDLDDLTRQAVLKNIAQDLADRMVEQQLNTQKALNALFLTLSLAGVCGVLFSKTIAQIILGIYLILATTATAYNIWKERKVNEE